MPIGRLIGRSMDNPIPEGQLPAALMGVKRALDRATVRELEQKRKLGQRIIIWKDDQTQIVDL